ncbi:DUF308 domain-containing protein [Methanosphaera sp.]
MELPSNFNVNLNAVILLLLGLIAISFPLVSTMTIGLITGFMFLMVALVLFITSTGKFIYNKYLGYLSIILAVLCLILSWFLMFDPADVTVLASYVIYILGIIMIISGISHMITAKIFKPVLIMGIIDVIFGILYIIVGTFISNPVHLGYVIGAWLLLSGILSLFSWDKN